ncbi:PREDICTED: protein IQ-DOMAIN 1-like isoform X2 [Brassica oleracea var. oleracea]|uniref:protein IQ-DOMAIN 1-like isoform X2 n=1 Tax=Brassica oleracea var. oleracea TaxID=109376 RepID=UPI0006A737FA|nr:PREDICTED: protein IQ-DOMAIN 1-like isoform X2 [Brassica oleracea var. oleracea]XP_013621310.1 PREDICTED: protein IQ-DOMAIN 1-like isoform X2 [Brassica oleracea var. oleracea]XP_013621311.1 PREDICTED: protein IQ-DOMAIN 1-like isoform X2 [Brassica oleracea var. oleracea]XP_013621312.1 PREDICTED: protein IQ-DOMAIN 1-like isoform X2 [Brassica oleracea var. oleracea]
MGKKAKWFSSVKKAFSPDSKSKRKSPESSNGVVSNPPPPPLADHHARQSSPPPLEVRVAEVIVEQNINLSAPSTDAVNATTSDIPVAPSSSAAPPEVVVRPRAAAPTRFAGKSNEEAAAILIQTVFRGYLAKRAIRAMRGLVRLRLLMEGSVVKRQAANTLKCMQTLSRVQSQIRARRIRMSEENQARQKQLLQKHAKELAGLKNGDNWDDSIQSKEKVEAKLLSKYEATMRRERALAYAYTHQQNWKNNSKSGNPMFMDPSNPTWGWSWLERWMAGRPLDNSSEQNNDNAASKPITRNNSTQPNTPSSARGGGGTPRNKNSFFSPPTPSRLNQSSRKSNDDDAKSTISVLSERNRRHSIAGSSVRDDESLAGSQTLPSYMVPTKSARARVNKPQSPSSGGGTTQENDGFTAKKRLSYPASPALPKPRRFSAPPKVEGGGGVAVTNGGGS